MVLAISESEKQRMEAVLLDQDGEEALRLIKEFVKRLQQQQRSGMKSHLDG